MTKLKHEKKIDYMENVLDNDIETTLNSFKIYQFYYGKHYVIICGSCDLVPWTKIEIEDVWHWSVFMSTARCPKLMC